MKYKNYLIFLIFLMLITFTQYDLWAQGIKKRMDIGVVRWTLVDSDDEGEGSFGWGESTAFHDGYAEGLFSSKAVMLACKNWKDSTGTVHPVKASGHGQWETDDRRVMMPVPDAEGWTIHKYLRYQPPSIVIDELPFQDPFPFNSSDHVDAAHMPGNADGTVESITNTDMGVTIKHRAIAFEQKNHNSYLIREYTFINTGNTDLDDDIELPGQTIEGFYFLKQLRTREWPYKPWVSSYGQKSGDDIFICYGYPSRSQGASFDDLGNPNLEAGGFLQGTYFYGETMLFASQSAGGGFGTNAIGVSQPHATMTTDVDFTSFTFHTRNMTDFQRTQLYQVMEEGLINVEGINWPEMPEARWGRHGERLDERGFANPEEMEGFGYSASVAYSIGPYNLAFGDSVKYVMAEVHSTISPEKAFDIGNKWLNNEPIDPPAGGFMPPQYTDFPELATDAERSDEVNLNKDMWVMSGRDSLFNYARAAKWAYENNYAVPQAPPAPSISVKSLPDGIRLTWTMDAGEPPDLEGFKIYRAKGNWWTGVPYGEDEFIGSWELLDKVSAGTSEYIDQSAQRGVAYFYAVSAVDDGAQNGQDMHHGQLVNNMKLESNFIRNITRQSANLLKPGGTLEDIVVVPNPFNLAASQIQFPGERNKIIFFNVPSQCTIRIFTESGDLVKVIDHEGSGDATWGDIPEQQSATETGQVVTSGLYVALIETPDGESTIRKFVIVR